MVDFGWTPQFNHGFVFTPHSPLTLLPASTVCGSSRPGPSGLIIPSLKPWPAFVRIRKVSFAGKRLSNGSFTTRQTACYPSSLAVAIANWVQPWLSVREEPEDGAGTCSSAYWQVPRERDFFRDLRQAWVSRILQPGFIQSVLGRLNSDSKSPLLTQAELVLFFADLRTWLPVSDQVIRSKLLEIDDGQLFRLNLWRALSLISSDPEADFF